MPEQIIEKIKKSILPVWRVGFVFALVAGLVAHLYKMTNWLPNWDSLVFRYDAQNMISLGRWFLPVVCSPSSFYDLPWITGLLAIIFYALGAVCIIKMFDIRKNITAALVGALVVTMPTVTSVMMYNYVADGYAVAFLLSCIAAMVLTTEKPRWILSGVLIALSCGIYQAYLSVTITLLLLYVIFELIYKNCDVKKIIHKCLKFLLAGILGMALYYAVLTALVKITGVELIEYQGVSSAVSFKSVDIAASLYAVKQLLIGYFFDFSHGISAFCLINCVIFILSAVMFALGIIKSKSAVSRLFVLFVAVALLPFGANVLVFINSSIDYHNLMKMGYVVFYLYFIMLYEKSEFKSIKLNIAKSWSVICLATLLVFSHIIISNVSYHKLNMAYEKSYGTLIRIADRIEQTDGANDCDSIAVIGAIKESRPYSAVLPPDITGTTDGYILRADDEIVGQSVVCSALNDYCGKNYKFLSGKEKEEIVEKINGDAMSTWPDKDSVLVADNVIVIKLGN